MLCTSLVHTESIGVVNLPAWMGGCRICILESGLNKVKLDGKLVYEWVCQVDLDPQYGPCRKKVSVNLSILQVAWGGAVEDASVIAIEFGHNIFD